MLLIRLFLLLPSVALAFTPLSNNPLGVGYQSNVRSSPSQLHGAREDEIRRKIMKLKKDGRIKKKTSQDSSTETGSDGELSSLDKLKRERQEMRENPIMDKYKDKISKKLGNKDKLLGSKFVEFEATGVSEKDDDIDEIPTKDDMDVDELEMLEAVERALEAKRKKEVAQQQNVKVYDEMEELAKKMNDEIKQKKQSVATNSTSITADKINKTTTGIGGAWANDEVSEVDTYRPANGGWGYFPRPKDISKAYGGGKRVGKDVKSTFEDELRKQKEVEETREKLRKYREKVGIEVQSEKDHAKEIEEALALGQRAMERGVYATAVSALEKVTKWCSPNSKVGGQVFLELAMAYEAVGRTSEAIQVYSTLTTSRMENIKYNAKRLLYGIEAMQFMRNEAKAASFSRKRASQTFIDTTGLGNIANNFDDKYNTAYVDLDRRGGFYRKLTESVVRSIREARQILLAATDSSEVDRTKIIQALRSMDRNFSDALREEIKRNAPKPETVAVINGVPIVGRDDEEESASAVGLNTFNLGDMDTVKENFNGVWKLQLIADSKGDGVSFFNKTLAWQDMNVEDMTYTAAGPSGFLSLSQSGDFEINEEQRIIIRKNVEKEGSAAFFTDVYSDNLSGPTASINLQQQIISVDSELLVTRTVLPKSKMTETIKGYFNVWRKSQTSFQ